MLGGERRRDAAIGPPGRTVGVGEALRVSAFAVPLNVAATNDPEGTRLTVWGRGDLAAVEGRPGAALDGGNKDYERRSGLTLTALYPYGGWTLEDGIELRAAAAAGRGPGSTWRRAPTWG